MSDTSPGELAEIFASPEKRDRWIVFTLLEIRNDIKAQKQELQTHREEDKVQFAIMQTEHAAQRERLNTVSSSVSLKEAGFIGGWRTLVVVSVIILAVIDIVFRLLEQLKP